jgi:pimeloyl-ACP methyl ester carboxylesterase
MVLIDSFSPELREAMPKDLWPSWIAWNTPAAAILQDYPDYEKVAYDKALDEVAANRSIPSMPLVVLTADQPYPAPTQPDLPANINTVTRQAQDVSQRQVAQLVPGAKHVTQTHSGHDIMLENPVLVSDSIGEVVAAVRQGHTTMSDGAAPTGSSENPTATTRDFSGLVDIGGGRRIFAECRGQGSPTVVLISGKGNGADDWLQILDPADPAHAAPGDDLPWGMGKLEPSADAVLPSVARFTRVCAYDRPDVRVDGTNVSTPTTQPHTVDQDVSDLHALLTALGEPGPYVLASHSYGGLIAALYARTYPDTVGGLVMIDTVTQLIESVASSAQLANWNATNAATSPQIREGVELIDAFAQIDAAPAMPKVPAIVLSADKPWRTDLLPPEAKQQDTVTFDQWLTSLDRLAAALDAPHITKTDSGHDIYLYTPPLVVDAIRGIVGDVRCMGDGDHSGLIASVRGHGPG